MTKFTSFALQFSNFTAASLGRTGAQLIVTESALTSAAAQPSLTATELTELAAAGKTVVAYVNTSVTDATRAYWNPAWVTPTHADEPDVGVVRSVAPAWLRNNLGGVDFAPEPAGQPAADEAIRVDYRDPAWRAMVVAQAVTQVQAGYGGVFLDDVGQYYQAGFHSGSYDPTLADSMMQLVIDVASAIRTINPAAKVIVNSGVYIGGDSSAGTAGALFATYKAAIDGMVIENQFSTENGLHGALSAALSAYPTTSIMALESGMTSSVCEKFLTFAARTGVLPYLVANDGYDSFAHAPQLGTDVSDVLTGESALANLIGGLLGDDRIVGGDLSDTLFGHNGNDTMIGNRGADFIYGGGGADRLYGSSGNDAISGHNGNDWVNGGYGNDILNGNSGNDTLYGGTGNDRLMGSVGADVFLFDASAAGHDIIYDFRHGWDRINLHALAPTLAEVKAAMHLQTTGFAGLRLDLTALGGHGSVLVLSQTNLADFTAVDFIL